MRAWSGGSPRPLVGGRLPLAALLLAAALALAACGGGGGGPTEPPQPQPAVVFTPATNAGSGSAVVLASGAGTDADTLELEVRARNVQDLYGVAFDLAFPADLLRFELATAGPFLPQASLQRAEGPAGTLVVGVSRLGPVAGVNGSGVIATFRFEAIAAGTGTFSFSQNAAVDSFGGALPGLAWSAGTVRVTR